MMRLFGKRSDKQEAAGRALDQSKAASERLLKALKERRDERSEVVNELLGSLVPERKGKEE